MNNLIVKENIKIKNMIYEVRGKQVMLDSDLAKLYHTETKRINEAVTRNKDKFPNRFTWILNDSEKDSIFEVANCDLKKERGGRRYKVRVFTEQGVAMLATILKSDVATKTSIAIMDAFVEMRKYISSNLIKYEYITNQVLKNTEDIKLLQESFDSFSKNKISTSGLFFEGQIYDSYSLLLDIFKTSKANIIIIDNYIDKSILDILREVDKKVTIITNKYNNNDYTKYKEQYKNIELIINNKIHDRFIIIDKNVLYHCGASFKDLGKKCFAINKIENNEWLEKILRNICK